MSCEWIILHLRRCRSSWWRKHLIYFRRRQILFFLLCFIDIVLPSKLWLNFVLFCFIFLFGLLLLLLHGHSLFVPHQLLLQRHLAHVSVRIKIVIALYLWFLFSSTGNLKSLIIFFALSRFIIFKRVFILRIDHIVVHFYVLLIYLPRIYSHSNIFWFHVTLYLCL